MAEVLIDLVRDLRAALVDFQADDWSGEDCAVLVEELATTEKVCAAARFRAAARAGACGAHKDLGFADVSDWIARVSGSTAGSAKAALDTAAAVQSQPEVKAALDSGELSFAQAREILSTEAECPGSAADLLSLAKQNSLKTLREQARDRRARAIDPEELHRMQHAAMQARHWRTKLGNVAITMEFPPEYGVPVANRMDAETDRLWQERRRSANPASDAGALFAEDPSPAAPAQIRAALAAQAFLQMLETGGKGKAHQADLVIVCDLRAYRRGHTEDGELCHIIGGGPIPVSLARELGQDAFLKACATRRHRDPHDRPLRPALPRGAPHGAHAGRPTGLRRPRVLGAGLR